MVGTLRRLLAVPLIFLIGCGSGAPTSRGAEAPAQPQAPAGPKRLVLATISEPVGFSLAIETQRLSVTQAGLAYYLFPGLTVADHQDVLRPTVGAAVPSVENGLWKVFPDGRMETTHPIRPGASWHDGTPLTGEDLRFTVTVVSDRDLPQFRMLGVDLIEGVEARESSAVVTWKQPFIDADALFGMIGNSSRSVPLPRHLLQGEYLTNKAGFTELRYWSDEFIGLGPYRLKEWVRGSHLVFAALMLGLLPVAHSVFTPGAPEYAATEANIVRYEYDPQRAARMLEELGFTRGADGMLRDASGQPLHMEVRAYAQRDIHQKTLFPLVDFWRQIGVSAEPVALPANRAQDAQEQATFPSFLILRQPNGLERLVALHSGQARTPERNYQGTNNGRYRNPEMDSLVDRYQRTIPWPERMQVAGQIVRHFTEQLPVLSLFYDALPIFVSNRVLNAHPSGNLAWNVHEWDLRP